MPCIRYREPGGELLPFISSEGRTFYVNHPIRRLNGKPVSEADKNMIDVYVKTKRWRAEVWKNHMTR